MKGFQVGVLIFFGVFTLLAVLIFSGGIKLGGKGGGTQAATVSSIKIWGTVPKKTLARALEFINNQNRSLSIVYIEKDPRTYEDELLKAFAFGGIPDLFLLSQDLITTYEDKIIKIPFTYFPERTFSDTYLRSADVFRRNDGFLGFPIFSDPLVMYYNQDLLETAGYSTPPKNWKDLFEYVPKLTTKNEALQITQSGVALGEFQNVRNAKEIIAAMNLQLNNPIVTVNSEGKYASVFASPSDVSSQPAVQSLNFYNEFSDPLKNVYSWNKSMADSQAAFIGGDLAIYFGLFSELKNIQEKNPNLNFDIAMIPQVAELKTKVTYADVYALTIPKNSPNAQIALSIAANMANGSNTAALAGSSGFAPIRRDLLSGSETNKFNTVMFDAALNARSWIDLDGTETNGIFSRMVESVISGLSNSEDAVADANTELKKLLPK